MSDRRRLKITVLRRLDPAELFDDLPVTLKNSLGPCQVFRDGQEIIVARAFGCPRASARPPGATSTTT